MNVAAAFSIIFQGLNSRNRRDSLNLINDAFVIERYRVDLRRSLPEFFGRFLVCIVLFVSRSQIYGVFSAFTIFEGAQ